MRDLIAELERVDRLTPHSAAILRQALEQPSEIGRREFAIKLATEAQRHELTAVA
jgi:hypothetical protein